MSAKVDLMKLEPSLHSIHLTAFRAYKLFSFVGCLQIIYDMCPVTPSAKANTLNPLFAGLFGHQWYSHLINIYRKHILIFLIIQQMQGNTLESS